MPDYNELMHIPMIVCHPDHTPGRIGAVTQNIDLLPTMLDIFGIPVGETANELHGKSVMPLIDGSREKNRDYALFRTVWEKRQHDRRTLRIHACART